MIYAVIIFICLSILAGASLKRYDEMFARERKDKEKTNPRKFAYDVCYYLNQNYKRGVSINQAIDIVADVWEKQNDYTADYEYFHKHSDIFYLPEPENPKCKWTVKFFRAPTSKAYKERMSAWCLYNLRRVKRNQHDYIVYSYNTDVYGFGAYVQPEVINSASEPVLKYYIDEKFYKNWVGDYYDNGKKVTSLDMISMNAVLRKVLPVNTEIIYCGEPRTIIGVEYNDKRTKAWYRLVGVYKKVNIFSTKIQYEEPWYIKAAWSSPGSCFLYRNNVTGDY